MERQLINVLCVAYSISHEVYLVQMSNYIAVRKTVKVEVGYSS